MKPAILDWLEDMGLEHLAKPVLAHGIAEPSVEVPTWVQSCFLTACSQGEVLMADSDAVCGSHWRGFMLLLERDQVTRDALDTLMRLDDTTDKMTLEIGQLYGRFKSALASTPAMKRLKQRQNARVRRITGQGFATPKRPTDAAFYAESQPPRVRRSR